MSDTNARTGAAQSMPLLRTAMLTAIAMFAFAGNSLLCRLALKDTQIDPASFTAVRLVSGGLVLALIVALRQPRLPVAGSWPSALALFTYAAAFSFAYVGLSAATGALLLFGAVQATMIGVGFWRGERFGRWQTAGLAAALAGLVALLLPGLSAPPLDRAAAMIAAGMAWGVYSLRAKGRGDPTAVTAGNFLRASPMALVLCIGMLPWASIDAPGVGYAVASGALASGVGYAVWYTALHGLKATTAATVQLSVPAIATIGGVMLLGEPVTLHLLLASAAVLGGIALVILARGR